MSHCKQCIHFKRCQKTFLRAKANGQYEDTTEEEYFGCADGCGWCSHWDIGRFTDGYCDQAKLKELEGDKE